MTLHLCFQGEKKKKQQQKANWKYYEVIPFAFQNKAISIKLLKCKKVSHLYLLSSIYMILQGTEIKYTPSFFL